MRGRRSVIVAVALMLGLVAGGTAYAFLHSLQQRAYRGARLTEVYMAAAPIGQGITGADAVGSGLIKKTEIPAKFRPTGTITDLAAIQNEVATSDIPAGQIVVAGLFASPSTTAGTAAQDIPKGDVAITVSVDPVHGVAGLVQPGDEVDVLVQLAPAGQETYLYQNVPVLAVGTSLAKPAAAVAPADQATATVPPPAPSSDLVTFAVPPDAAARIALAQSGGGGVTGGIYLALVPPGSPPSPAPTTINASNLIPAIRVPG